jgi:hypothetical protein
MVFKNVNFGQFFGLIFPFDLYAGTRVYTVVRKQEHFFFRNATVWDEGLTWDTVVIDEEILGDSWTRVRGRCDL